MANQVRCGVIVAIMMSAAAASAQQAAITPAETKDLNLRAYVELLRADVRAQKVAIITHGQEHLKLPAETRLQFQFSAAVTINP